MQNFTNIRKINETPANSAEYFKKLDELLRRKKGGSTLQGTNLDTGFRVPGGTAMANASGLEANSEYPLPQYEAMQEPMGDAYAASAQNSQFISSVGDGESVAAKFFDQGSGKPKEVGQTDDGGTQYDTGVVIYPDGTYKETPESERTALPTPVFFMGESGDGLKALFSDGTIRIVSQGYVDAISNPQQIQGTSGLALALFGIDEPITQNYGENPNMGAYGTEGHMGVDYGVVNKPLTSFFTGTVLEAGNNGLYGNSVLIQLEDGSKIRLSHLSDIGVQVGQQINPTDYIGTTGNTGNSTGPHLDLEYYDPSGKAVDPATFNFAGIVAPSTSGKAIPDEQLSPEDKTYRDSYVNTGQLPVSTPPEPIQEPVQPIQEPNILQSAATSTANAIDQWNPTGTKVDLGATELLRSDPALALQKATGTVEYGAQKLNQAGIRTPEYGVGEAGRSVNRLAKGESTLGAEAQRLPGFIAEAGAKNSLGEHGVSELASSLISGLKDLNIEGKLQQLADTLGINKAVSQKTSPFAPQKVYAMGNEMANTAIPGVKSMTTGNLTSGAAPAVSPTVSPFQKSAISSPAYDSNGSPNFNKVNTGPVSSQSVTQTFAKPKTSSSKSSSNKSSDKNKQSDEQKRMNKGEDDRKKEKEKKKVTSTRSTSGFSSGFSGGGSPGGGGGSSSW